MTEPTKPPEWLTALDTVPWAQVLSVAAGALHQLHAAGVSEENLMHEWEAHNTPGKPNSVALS